MLTRRVLMAALALSPVTLHAGSLTAHDFSFPSIEGGTISLAEFTGRPVLVVNTASKCDYTYQYDGLKALYDRYRARGLVVLGVPSDDFGGQELETEAAVKDFCAVNFAIDFPMTSITVVKGKSAHPFYVWARDQLGADHAPRWNFHKYLVGPDGRLVASFGSRIEPTASQVTSAIESLLPQG